MISLLYPDGCRPTASLWAEEGFLSSYFEGLPVLYRIPSSWQRTFLDVLAHPLGHEDDILYRRSILSDFQAEPRLWEVLSAFAEDTARLRRSFSDQRRRMYSGTVHGSFSAEENRFYTTFLPLQEDCVEFCSLAAHAKALVERISQLSFASEGVRSFCAFVSRFSLSRPVVAEAADACHRLSETSITDFLWNSALTVTLVEDLRFAFSELSFCAAGGVGRIFSTDSVSEAGYRVACRRACECVRNDLKRILDAFYSPLDELRRSLEFYGTALRLEEEAREKRIPVSFPAFSRESFSVEDLYDFRLQSKLNSPMLPRTASFSQECVLITGGNNAGKTVFLRSVILLHLLAQAGLFVFARAARIPLFSSLSILFASEESADSVGRFEAEVKTLAEIDRQGAGEGDLVILNEIFQSALYRESEVVLGNILRAWTERGCRWLAVTHLHLPIPENGAELHFSESFKP